MGRYRIVFRKSVSRDLRPTPNRDLRKILAAIESLSEKPRPEGIEKLSGQDRYRMRRGDYRIIYEIKEEEIMVVVVKVGHRKDVYRRSESVGISPGPAGEAARVCQTKQFKSDQS